MTLETRTDPAPLARVALAILTASVASEGRTARAEEPTMHAGALAHALDRLSNTGRVLYIAAHPDDENTRLLAYLANGRHVSATYLSMTRGGGGQNLIGREQAELLDVLRTEELLAARRLDRASQRFTRMLDFGYSKTAEETLAAWDHEEALSDVVWIVRSFQPDVIITRFDERPPNHGHHTASAILAREAFAAAADPKRFPEQLAKVEPWSASRLLYNLPSWRNDPVPADALTVDVGGYDARLGLSYGELAARSRSQHKSQGFGAAEERGVLPERFLWVAGSRPKQDILEGIELGWKRFGDKAAVVERALAEARSALRPEAPERAIPALLRAARALDALPNVPRVLDARRAIDRVIADAAGLFVRATAARPMAVPGTRASVKVEVLLRRPASMTLGRLRFSSGEVVEVNAPLGAHEKREVARDVAIAEDAPISAPYYLAEPASGARQTVLDPSLIGEPEGPWPLGVTAEVHVGDRTLRLDVPVVHTWTDPVQGERTRRFVIAPPATVTPARQAVLFPNGQAATVNLRVRAAQDAVRAEVSLPLPPGWRVEPPAQPVSLERAGDEAIVAFQVRAPANAAALEVGPVVRIGERSWSFREDVIDYPHVPMQVVLQQAVLRFVPLTLKLPKGDIGYVLGSGDSGAEDLAHVGLKVELLDDDALRGGDLTRFAAIVIGIRAYNTRASLRAAHARLMAYVEAGGTVVTQYNTNNRFGPLELEVGPYPLQIGRGRVTDQTAEMTPLDSKNPALSTPNVLGPEDFKGWVQERGLYFAERWDPRYQPLFQIRDPGEEPQLGGVLLARHGRGRYVYTGLSFFRQLPAGVPGAYRLLANLIGGKVSGGNGP